MKFGHRLKSVVAAVAPTIGSALGGPLGGAAATAIAAALGVRPEAKAIAKAIESATPDQLIEIKKAEQTFEERMRELDVDVFKLETLDVQNARLAFGGDWTPRVFGLFALLGFIAYVFLVTVRPPDSNSDAIVSLVLGYLGGLVSAITSFYFGASHTKPHE